MKLDIEIQRLDQSSCPDCGGIRQNRRYYVVKNDKAWCIGILEKYIHQDSSSEIYISVIFGDLGSDNPASENTTFTARYGHGIEGQEAPAYTLVRESRDDDIFGHRLTRDEALRHNRIKDFWDAIDFISHEDPGFFDLSEE